MAIAVNDALFLVKEWEPLGGQRQQRALFDLEKLPHLLFCRAVNALVGDVLLPMQQMSVLFSQRWKDAAFERVLLDVIDARFDFAKPGIRDRRGRLPVGRGRADADDSRA